MPILGFFPAAVAVFITITGGSALGVEAAAVFLIFTSMFWNLAFSVYETLITLPEELNLAAAQFGIKGPMRWRRLILPAVAPNLLYNSILSWSNGWYFLMASEIIAAGQARYTLPGLGSYLGQAIAEGRNDQMMLALLALLVTTLGMHLLVWSPLETWAERFHVDETGNRPRVSAHRARAVAQPDRALVRAPRGAAGGALGGVDVGAAPRPARPLRQRGRHHLRRGRDRPAPPGRMACRAVRVEKPLSAEARDIPISLALSFGAGRDRRGPRRPARRAPRLLSRSAGRGCGRSSSPRCRCWAASPPPPSSR